MKGIFGGWDRGEMVTYGSEVGAGGGWDGGRRRSSGRGEADSSASPRNDKERESTRRARRGRVDILLVARRGRVPLRLALGTGARYMLGGNDEEAAGRDGGGGVYGAGH